MNWNDAAEDLLGNILSQMPLPMRGAAQERIRSAAEQIAEEAGSSRVGVETVVEAWVKTTEEPMRSDIPRLMDKFGLDPSDYERLFS